MKTLVVDNSPLTLELMTDLLTDQGHQVLTAEDGVSALDILKDYVPEIIFVDLVMPNIDGIRLARIIRQIDLLKDCYLVILSATAAEEDIDLALLGANEFIAKGRFSETAPYLLAAIEHAGSATSRPLAQKIVGLEHVYPREITRELLSSKKHFEIVLGRMSEGILEISSTARVVYANPASVALVGIPEQALLGMSALDIFGNDNRAMIEALLPKNGAATQSTAEVAQLNLRDRILSLRFIPVTPNETERAIIIVNDVTEQKHAEQEIQNHRAHLEELVNLRTSELRETNLRLEQEIADRRRAEQLLKASLEDIQVLLREVHHRTKNNMQVISSLLDLQSAQVTEENVLSIFRDSQSRIRAMALIHETLYHAKTLNVVDLHDYVTKLTHGLCGAYRIGNAQIALTIDVHNVFLGIDTAVPCGLIINELVANSLKHAFPNNRSGTITITAKCSSENVIDLVACDDGVGVPANLDFRKTKTLGLQLVTGIVENQLGGSIEILPPPGAGFRIRFQEKQYKERL
jgi:PAS domain S-box-containing protein